MTRIAAVAGPKRGVVIEIGPRFAIGRAHDANLQLIDDKVSREHCAITVEESGAVARDLGSRNGTWIEGQRIEGPRTLRAGDRISVGETVLIFEPDFEAIAARDGESTLVLTRSSDQGARRPAPLGPDAYRAAGELALRAATAPDRAAARQLLAEAAGGAFDPAAVMIGLRRPGGPVQPLICSPAGAIVSVGLPLIDLAFREGRAVAQRESQSRTERSDERTLLRSDPSWVLAAPAGHNVLAVVRSREFTSEELALATAIAAALGPALAEPTVSGSPDASLIAESAVMRAIVDRARDAAKARSIVLLSGASGTGKEAIARLIHREGARAAGPFVPINCGAIPAELAESELFGHEKGAFTGATSTHAGVFERAHGGTLFLDEIGDLPPALQVKLLRVLEERVVQRLGGRAPIGVDVRIIAATHRDLEAAVKAGTFRDDLFWRLNVLRLHLPPLAERAEDVLPLAERFLLRSSLDLGRRPEGFTAEAREALLACRWPGNIRQLANAIERSAVWHRGDGPIELFDLPPEVVAPEARSDGRTLAELIRVLEKEQITTAILRARGVKVAAAEALGISRPTLDRKIEEYGIAVR